MDIDKLIKEATLEKNSAKKETYRAIKSELLLNNSSKNSKPEGKETGHFKIHCNDGSEFEFYTNELDTSIIRKLIKQREENIVLSGELKETLEAAENKEDGWKEKVSKILSDIFDKSGVSLFYQTKGSKD